LEKWLLKCSSSILNWRRLWSSGKNEALSKALIVTEAGVEGEGNFDSDHLDALGN